MEILNVPRIVLSGSDSGTGKFFVGLGLGGELKRRGLSVSACVVGPNLPQAAAHRRMIGRFVRTIDLNILTSQQALTTAFMASVGSDMLLIHGRGRLLDRPALGRAKTPDLELASILKAPTVAVCDVSGAQSAAEAQLKKISALFPAGELLGWIGNRAEGAGGAAAAEEPPRRFGDLQRASASPPSPPRFPSEAKNMGGLPHSFLQQAAQLVGRQVDIDGLILAAQNVISVRLADFDFNPTPRRTRVAFADDACLHLCFQDNLDLFRYFGAELVPFSPLADSSLPDDIGGLYLPGGFLGDYGEEVSRNADMLNSIAEFSRAGGVIYSEGAGTALLAEQFQCGLGGPLAKGAGVIAGEAWFKPNAWGYIETELVEESILGPTGAVIRGIDTGEWSLKERGRVFMGLKGTRTSGARFIEGFSPSPHSLCTFCFLHFGSNMEAAKSFVDSAEVRRPIKMD